MSSKNVYCMDSIPGTRSLHKTFRHNEKCHQEGKSSFAPKVLGHACVPLKRRFNFLSRHLLAELNEYQIEI